MPAAAAPTSEILTRVRATFATTVVGQAGLLRSLLLGVLGDGHALIESVPGLAKTTAARTLAACFAVDFARIQCTPDLLPADIVGGEVFHQSRGEFSTRLGPVHANFVLVDEINRASAKTQSALLEAMQERQTTIAGVVHRLPDPFFVVATQNPIEQEGTYLLPEAQLDRFLVKAVLDYPTPSEEDEVLRREHEALLEVPVEPVATVEELHALRAAARRVRVSPELRRYMVRLVAATRDAGAADPSLRGYVELGASPRGAIALQVCARVSALLDGRDHALPEDVKGVRHEVLRHRIAPSLDAMADGVGTDAIVDAIFDAVPVP